MSLLLYLKHYFITIHLYFSLPLNCTPGGEEQFLNPIYVHRAYTGLNV